jgi:3-dehydroquinate synthase
MILQKFEVGYQFPVYFTENLFKEENLSLRGILEVGMNNPAKVMVVTEKAIHSHHPDLAKKIENYFLFHKDVISNTGTMCLIDGGENCKNDFRNVELILEGINRAGICRHSYVIAIGGGALLDLAGFAAAIAHRGVRLIRIPTTVLSQNDSGVGVKNSINFFGKKNFLGTFAPPFAVINDFEFLRTLDQRDWISGIAEAIKVALIKDKTFFEYIKENVRKLKARDAESMKYLIRRCAQLHIQHIASGDPFEKGSSRPLDFGHWAAHKLEYLTNFDVRHGEAVAIGMALDCTYSFLNGMLTEKELLEILQVLESAGFDIFHEKLLAGGGTMVLQGITEFREHLGGKLTVMLLEKIGKGKEVHYLNEELMLEAIEKLKEFNLKIRV